MNHICIAPSGVLISMQSSRLPPARTSISATGMVAPPGPYHVANCSGSVHILQTWSAGALRFRTITMLSVSPPVLSVSSAIVIARPSSRCLWPRSLVTHPTT